MTTSSATGASRWSDARVVEVVRRYWWFTAIVVGVALAATFVLTSVQTPIYSASTSVVLRTNDTASLFPLRSSAPIELQRSADVEQVYASSPEFREVARPGTPKGVRVTSRAGASELIFTARGADPVRVAAAANHWAATYVVERHRSVVAELQADADFTNSQIADLEALRGVVRSELDATEALIERAADSDQLSRLLVRKVALDASLEDDLFPIEQQLAMFRAQRASFDYLTYFLAFDDIGALVVSEATAPTEPVTPNLRRNLTVAALLGTALGLALPWVRLTLSDTVEEKQDVVHAAGLPVLTTIVDFDHAGDGTVEVFDHAGSRAAEQYQALLTAIEFEAVAEPIRSVFFTSALPAEGKTTTVVNVASLAAQYQQVLVIDADMRRPGVHRVLGATNAFGLSDVLGCGVTLDDARQRIERNEVAFDLLSAGPAVDDPALLLRGSAWAELLEDCDDYDLIIVDGPPVLAVTDSLLIGAAVDAQVMMVRSRKTERRTLVAARDLLATNHTRTLGAVVNRAPDSHGAYYEYYRKENERSDEPQNKEVPVAA